MWQHFNIYQVQLTQKLMAWTMMMILRYKKLDKITLVYLPCINVRVQTLYQGAPDGHAGGIWCYYYYYSIEHYSIDVTWHEVARHSSFSPKMQFGKQREEIEEEEDEEEHHFAK